MENFKEKVARVTGLEPATSGVTGRRSNQLSYTPASAIVIDCGAHDIQKAITACKHFIMLFYEFLKKLLLMAYSHDFGQKKDHSFIIKERPDADIMTYLVYVNDGGW